MKHKVKNKMLAIMSDPMFKQRIVKPKKGKGSYNRKNQKYSLITFITSLIN